MKARTFARSPTLLQGVSLTWLPDASEETRRAALAAAAPALSRLPLRVNPFVANSDPQWWAASAVAGSSHVVKFAWSEVAAVRLDREARLLAGLRGDARPLRLPEIVVRSRDPVLLATLIVPGSPLRYEDMGSLDGELTRRVAGELGGYLARLHAPTTRSTADALGITFVTPEPQADTDALRTRLTARLSPRQAALVRRWCDWTDAVLERDHSSAVLVHGHLHGYNQVWCTHTWKLRAVVDYEVCAVYDPHYDFRYLPGQSPTLDLLHAVIADYERRTQTRVRLDRVMAWNVRTTLGDALWRTEAGVELPGGGTAAGWVEALDMRMRQLGFPASQAAESRRADARAPAADESSPRIASEQMKQPDP